MRTPRKNAQREESQVGRSHSLFGWHRQAMCGMELVAVSLLVLPLRVLAQEEPAPADPPDPSSRRAPEAIKRERERAGFPPMTADSALVESASGHVRYYVANPGDPALAGLGLHQQRPDTPSFTGPACGILPVQPATAGPLRKTPASGGWTLPSTGRWAPSTTGCR
jgi:hypothetical protein